MKIDEPWIVAVYIHRKGLSFRHKGARQGYCAKMKVQSVNRIPHVLFNVSMITLYKTSSDDITNRRVGAFLLKTMHGIAVPKTPKQALELDTVNHNQLWSDIIQKENNTIRECNMFSPVQKSKIIRKEVDLHPPPLHYVFAVKTELCHRVRMVMGGHVTTAGVLDKYAATTSIDGVIAVITHLQRKERSAIW